jgi:hypothetical protein
MEIPAGNRSISCRNVYASQCLIVHLLPARPSYMKTRRSCVGSSMLLLTYVFKMRFSAPHAAMASPPYAAYLPKEAKPKWLDSGGYIALKRGATPPDADVVTYLGMKLRNAAAALSSLLKGRRSSSHTASGKRPQGKSRRELFPVGNSL